MRKLRLDTAPIDSAWSEGTESGKSLSSLTEFHHQRIARFLKQPIVKVVGSAAPHDLLNSLQLGFDVEQLLRGSAVHQSATASR